MSHNRIASEYYPFQLNKILPLGLMLLFMSFSYVILRDTKDVLVLTAPGSGFEILIFLKLYSLYATILFVLIYVALSTFLSRQALFYAILFPFVLFFGTYFLLIYPNHETLHLTPEAISALQLQYPSFAHAFPAIGNWTYSLFYILADLWPAAIITTLFWQFSNEIMTVKEAKRFYIILAMFGSIGVIIGGLVVGLGVSVNDTQVPWSNTLRDLMTLVSISMTVVLILYFVMNRYILQDERLYKPTRTDSGDVIDKPTLPFMESLFAIFKSPYMWLIIGIVFAYALSLNLTEIIWKGQVKNIFSSPQDYNAFLGQVSYYSGFSTLPIMIVGFIILYRYSWFIASVTTPIILLITSLFYFGLVMYANTQDPSTPFMGTTLGIAIAWVGKFQNVSIKNLGIFMATIQIAYIPLVQDLKVKGKAVIDVFFARLSNSFAALLVMNLPIISGGAKGSLIPVLALLLIAIVAFWIFCVRSLSTRFEALNKAQNE